MGLYNRTCDRRNGMQGEHLMEYYTQELDYFPVLGLLQYFFSNHKLTAMK